MGAADAGRRPGDDGGPGIGRLCGDDRGPGCHPQGRRHAPARTRQGLSQAIGAAVQCAIRQLLPSRHQRRRRWCALHLTIEPPIHAQLWQRTLRPALQRASGSASAAVTIGRASVRRSGSRSTAAGSLQPRDWRRRQRISPQPGWSPSSGLARCGSADAGGATTTATSGCGAGRGATTPNGLGTSRCCCVKDASARP